MCQNSGGNLGGATTLPPPPSQKMTNFRKFGPKRGLKTAVSSTNGGGGGGCRKFESFVGNLGGFAPTGKSEFPPLCQNAPF